MITDARFEACLPIILREEGGNNDDPQDHGGRTSRGITQREYSVWRVNCGLAERDVFEASDQEIHDIYYESYWLPRGPKLHPGVDLVFFNFAVNAGPEAAHAILMRSIGPDNEDNDPQTIKRMCDAGAARYRGLAQFPRYGRGWLARTLRIRAAAMKMQKDNPVYDPKSGQVPRTSPIPQSKEPTMFNPMILVQLFTMMPKLVQAVQAILASDAAHTIESAIEVLTGHVTPGQPNAPALGPTAPPVATK